MSLLLWTHSMPRMPESTGRRNSMLVTFSQFLDSSMPGLTELWIWLRMMTSKVAKYKCMNVHLFSCIWCFVQNTTRCFMLCMSGLKSKRAAWNLICGVTIKGSLWHIWDRHYRRKGWKRNTQYSTNSFIWYDFVQDVKQLLACLSIVGAQSEGHPISAWHCEASTFSVWYLSSPNRSEGCKDKDYWWIPSGLEEWYGIFFVAPVLVGDVIVF